VSLRAAWDENADDWIRWARAPGHDSYWRFHQRRFLELLPPPGRLTVDVGCGEGRVGRDLLARGHRVAPVDASPVLARACATHSEVPQPVVLGDAAALPLRSACADLVIAFMSLMDVDDLEGAVHEAARVLEAGGRLCVAIVHPINSAGRFTGERGDPDAPFVITGSYLEQSRYSELMERDGLTMTFHSAHYSLEYYSRVLEDAGFGIEALREVGEDDPADRWSRLPLFLHIRARRAAA
jgi:SAM-dependent methyltransferase